MSISGLSGSARQMAVSGASARMPPQQKMSSLFNRIDSAGSGSIDQSQFDQAFATLNPPAAIKAQGADAIWAKLDPNGTGSVSKADFISTMKSVIASAHTGGHHHHGGATATDALSSASQSLDSLGTDTSAGVNILV